MSYEGTGYKPGTGKLAEHPTRTPANGVTARRDGHEGREPPRE
jgi:hypothetical protein